MSYNYYMDDVCKDCGMCCKIIPIDWESKTMFRNGMQKYDEDFEDYLIPLNKEDLEEFDMKYISSIKKAYPNLGFFTCKYFQDCCCTNNTKHELCEFPTSPFAILADNCSFSGEIFIKKEAIKQKIRKLKEEIIDYEAQILTTKDKKEKDHLKKIIIYHQKFIGKYKIYGSKHW